MRRPRTIATGALTVLATVALISGGTAEATVPSSQRLSNTTDGSSNLESTDATSALVQLQADPLAISPRTKPAKGKKIDFNSTAVKAERALLSAQRNDFKAWLRDNAPKAKMTAEFDLSLNAVSLKLNGESLAAIAASPLVRSAQPQFLYHPLAADPDLGIIKAVEAWNQAGGSANAGAGVKVAVIDTGIDITNPCFSDGGYQATNQLGDSRFTNNKVIAAKVFYNKAANQGLTAEAIQSHGSHVAGTIACNFETPVTVDGVAIPYAMSGVAPKALLGNYNVFPGQVGNARSEDILNALEAAYADGFDVANMSLGGDASGIQDLLPIAVDNLDQANMVVAISAGNSGPGARTVGSPGSAQRALTAGASTVPHFMGAPVTVGGTSYGAAAGDFAKVASDLTAPLAAVTSAGVNPTTGLAQACAPLSDDLTGKIALVSRGTCSFSAKIRFAQQAGAVAVLVVNNVGGDPIAMGGDGTADQPTVPAYQLSLVDGTAIKASSGADLTIGSGLAYFTTSNVDIMAGFSSQGPTDVDFRVKPDVVAPGVNVLSAISHHDNCNAAACWAFFQGTSMASPHLAGTAAVVKQQHPDWTSAQIRSAIVNTADQGVLKNFNATAIQPDVQIVGAGRENVLNAVNAVAGLDPVSTSFGAVPAGSGQTMTSTVTITNISASAQIYALSVDSVTGSGVAFSVSDSSVTLAAGESATVTVTMAADKGASGGNHQGMLRLSSGGVEVAHSVLYVFMK